MSLTKKIDFAIIISVKNANPNGDPLNGNRPRTNYEGYGEISDVCIKRKIRNRLLDAGEAILVQSDDYRNDNCRSIKDRYDKKMEHLSKSKDGEEKASEACKIWFDVRAFGQVFAGVDKKNASIAIRGPVSVQSAFSVEPVDVASLQITKSVNLTTNKKDPAKKSSDTMGMKHRVDRGVYMTFGSINRQLAEKTGFSDSDAETLKKAMLRLFENDESTARPAGSMEVLKVIWWTHTDTTLSSAEVHRSLTVNADGTYKLELDKLDGLRLEELDGM
ncbi:MAG: type I-C CRISPR-associated protein Cas7/Csd2 [Syntrophobacterales bacterium]|jgi:CRISPR-associated protein Csd2|nr:type I-C CRISPR-associated protein Cas7/Csd2 [Syntrophobacterales bacterium]